MNKEKKPKYYPITTLIVTILIVVLAIFTYNKYLKPFYSNHNPQISEFDFLSDTTLLLVKPTERGNVFSAQLEIFGQSANNLEIVMSDAKMPRHNAIIKKGKIDFIYLNDWYSDTIVLQISSNGPAIGHLKVEYTFQCIE